MARKKVTPKRRKCACMEVFMRLCDDDPHFAMRQVAIEESTRRFCSKQRFATRVKPFVIPVIVHVLWNTKAENVSVTQIRSQIRALNRDFRKKNADSSKVPGIWSGIAADARIQFKLATTDPHGRKTTGITRTRTDRSSFSQSDAMKYTSRGGINAWPRDRYLNIWVCTLSGGLLGYAQFPGGPRRTDGVVVHNRAFGTVGHVDKPFHRGRTATHEVGHFLNLRHIWGDTTDCSGSDLVSDTPPQRLPNQGKPKFPQISCSNGPNGDMFMNYMDYVDDEAMFMFTQGQVARMHAALMGPRKKLAK